MPVPDGIGPDVPARAATHRPRAESESGRSTWATTLPSDFALRPAEVDDAMVLGFLELQLFPGEAWTVFQLAEEIEHPDRRYAVVENVAGSAPEIVGYAGIMIAGDAADLHTIGTVVPGRGIGRALLAWCEERALDGGAERMLLEVREDNDRARAVYERAGYEEIARRPGYYRLPDRTVDAIVMQRDLRSGPGLRL